MVRLSENIWFLILQVGLRLICSSSLLKHLSHALLHVNMIWDIILGIKLNSNIKWSGRWNFFFCLGKYEWMHQTRTVKFVTRREKRIGLILKQIDVTFTSGQLQGNIASLICVHCLCCLFYWIRLLLVGRTWTCGEILFFILY